MNCLLVMKIKWSLDINTGAVERSEAARAALRALQWGVPYADSSVFYKKCTKTRIGLWLYALTIGPLVRSGPRFIAYPWQHFLADLGKTEGKYYFTCNFLHTPMYEGFKYCLLHETRGKRSYEGRLQEFFKSSYSETSFSGHLPYNGQCAMYQLLFL